MRWQNVCRFTLHQISYVSLYSSLFATFPTLRVSHGGTQYHLRLFLKEIEYRNLAIDLFGVPGRELTEGEWFGGMRQIKWRTAFLPVWGILLDPAV